jgi:hypothetical protein
MKLARQWEIHFARVTGDDRVAAVVNAPEDVMLGLSTGWLEDELASDFVDQLEEFKPGMYACILEAWVGPSSTAAEELMEIRFRAVRLLFQSELK